jgi:hypothetical protein
MDRRGAEELVNPLTPFPHVVARAADQQVMAPEVRADGVEVQSCLAELSGLLSRERVVLDRLADALVAGEPDADCDALYHSISSLELHRAIAAREAAIELAVEGNATLGELARLAPEEWTTVLDAHRRALLDLIAEVGRLALRPLVDIRDVPEDAVDLRGTGVRRQGVQRSLREFIGGSEAD